MIDQDHCHCCHSCEKEQRVLLLCPICGISFCKDCINHKDFLCVHCSIKLDYNGSEFNVINYGEYKGKFYKNVYETYVLDFLAITSINHLLCTIDLQNECEIMNEINEFIGDNN